MGKKVLVKATSLTIQFGAHHQAGSTTPQDAGSDVVVLAVVVFNGFKDAATAIGVAVTVKVATGSTGVLKHLAAVVAVVQQFGLYGSHLGMRL